MAKTKEKELVHYFKVTAAQDPTASDAMAVQQALETVSDVISVDYIRSTMRTKADE